MRGKSPQLDRYLDALRTMPNEVGAAVRAIDHAEAHGLPPYEMALAANAAMEAADGTSERDWLLPRLTERGTPPLAGVPHADAPHRIGQAVANLIDAGLWPW